MRERLDYIKVTPARVLDAGCGTGADLPGLRERFADASVLGIDLSRGDAGARELRRDAESEANAGWRRFLPATLGKAFGARGPQLRAGRLLGAAVRGRRVRNASGRISRCTGIRGPISCFPSGSACSR